MLAHSLPEDPFKRLLQVVGQHEKKELQTHSVLINQLQGINLQYGEHFYQVEQVIGGGYWSYVFLLSRSVPDKEEKEHVVLKMLKPLLGNLLLQGFQEL